MFSCFNGIIWATYEAMSSVGQKSNHATLFKVVIAELFSGNEKYGSASIKQIAHTGMRLPRKVAKCIKEFEVPEYLALFAKSEVLN